MNWEVRMGIDALLHTKLIDNKDVVCSLEKSVQYSVIAYIGKESEKEWLCVCVCVYGIHMQTYIPYVYTYAYTIYIPYTYIYTYAYAWLIHFAVHLKLTKHCKSPVK